MNNGAKKKSGNSHTCMTFNDHQISLLQDH